MTLQSKNENKLRLYELDVNMVYSGERIKNQKFGSIVELADVDAEAGAELCVMKMEELVELSDASVKKMQLANSILVTEPQKTATIVWEPILDQKDFKSTYEVSSKADKKWSNPELNSTYGF